MKAWLAFKKNDDEKSVAIVFAETAGKAKAIAIHTAACEDSDFTDISVNRLPKADKMYKPGKIEMDWNDPKDRLFMVKNCDFYCSDVVEKVCNECSAKNYCYIHDNPELLKENEEV